MITKENWGKYPKSLDGKITSKYGTSRLRRVKSSIYYLVLSDVVLNIRCTSDLSRWMKKESTAGGCSAGEEIDTSQQQQHDAREFHIIAEEKKKEENER